MALKQPRGTQLAKSLEEDALSANTALCDSITIAMLQHHNHGRHKRHRPVDLRSVVVS